MLDKLNNIPVTMPCGHTLNHLQESALGKRTCAKCGHVYAEGLDDQKKSVMLAKAMGWNYPDRHHVMDEWQKWVFPFTGAFDLYDPANMHLAWQCHLWAWRQVDVYTRYRNLWRYNIIMSPIGKPDAQRLWLNKILSLAIEAGLVEVQDVA